MVLGIPYERVIHPQGFETHRLRTTDRDENLHELLAYRWQYVCDITLDRVGSHFLPETLIMAFPIDHPTRHLSTQSSSDLSWQNSSSSSEVCGLFRRVFSCPWISTCFCQGLLPRWAHPLPWHHLSPSTYLLQWLASLGVNRVLLLLHR